MYDSRGWFWLKGKSHTTLDAILSPKCVFFISIGEGVTSRQHLFVFATYVHSNCQIFWNTQSYFYQISSIFSEGFVGPDLRIPLTF